MSGGFFTSLWKRLAFAAALSRLVAAAELLGFFGRLPNIVGTALRFFPPLRAPARQRSSRRAGRLLVGGGGRLLPRRRSSPPDWPRAAGRLLPRRHLPKPPPLDRGRRCRSPP